MAEYPGPVTFGCWLPAPCDDCDCGRVEELARPAQPVYVPPMPPRLVHPDPSRITSLTAAIRWHRIRIDHHTERLARARAELRAAEAELIELTGTDIGTFRRRDL